MKTSPEVAAAVVELEKENRRLRSQLGRRESDAIQAMHGEVSEERETAARRIATLEGLRAMLSAIALQPWPPRRFPSTRSPLRRRG